MDNWQIFLSLGIIALLIYANTDSEYNDLPELIPKNLNKVSVNNYPHFDDNNLTYAFSDSCIGPTIPKTKLAFEIISNNTERKLNFTEIPYGIKPDIIINCNSGKEFAEGGGFYLGEGGPSSYYQDSKVIVYSELNFYSVTNTTSTQSCYSLPVVEIHEILHALGIDHHEGGYDIMSKQFDMFTCKYVTKMNEKYSDCLKAIYSNVKSECEGVNFLF
ncbi:MAG TPA: matrixin family metalloprotease [Candidatus Nanoarchaeia archaeon]|nr:matrixin family metalloprotease [Candidatus Nanoarchaeia archaeon]